MKLYVANCTKQEFLFTYMLPENIKAFSHHIRSGAQIELNHSKDEVDAIVKQHSIYGMQPVENIKKGFGGLTYRIDKPINVNAIEQGLSQKDQEAIDQALEARKITAVVSDKIISEKAQELGLKTKSGLEVEVVEEKKNLADTEPKFEQTIEVVKDGLNPMKSRGRPRKS